MMRCVKIIEKSTDNLVCEYPIILGGLNGLLYVYMGCLGHILADKSASWLPKRQKFKLRVW